MLKTIIEFVNALLIDLAKHRWIQHLVGPLFPDIGFVDISHPSHPQRLRLFLSLQDVRGPSFQLLNRRQDGFEDYDKPLRTELLKHLPEDGVLVDVGANIGIITLATSLERPRARIIALEPDPVHFLALNKTQKHNSLSNIDILPLTLGENEKLKTLYFETPTTSLNALDGHSRGPQTHPLSRLVFSLDQLHLILSMTRLDVLKIDSPGSELEVLKGAKRTLEQFKPVIAVAFNFKEMAAPSITEFMKTLATPYQISEPHQTELFDLNQLAERVQNKKALGFFYGDFIFVPQK